MKWLDNKKKYYFTFSVIFAFFASVILFFYYSQGITMIDFRGDGMRQHYRALLYYAHLLKTTFSDLFGKGIFTIPQWEYSLGEGGDILTTLHYYGVGDPISFLSIFFPEKYMYLFYDVSVFVKMYLSGITFSLLAMYLQNKNYHAILTGALIYTFSAFSLMNLSGHTIFLSSVIYLPLILYGAERTIRNDRPYLLSVAVLLSSLSNLIFFYMNVLMTVVYVLVRLVFLQTDLRTKAVSLLRIALYSALGLLMSFVVFLPMSYTMLFNERLSDSFNNSLFYTINEYRSFFVSYVFSYGVYYGNYSILGLLAALRLFRSRKNYTLKILFILGAIFLCLPFFGKLLNGMVYSSVRWVYGLALLVAYIVMERFEDLSQIDLIDTIITIAYLIRCHIMNSEFSKIYLMYALMALLYYLMLKFRKLKDHYQLALVAIIAFSTLFSIAFRYSPFWWNYTNLGARIASIETDTYPDEGILDTIEDDSFWRYSGDSIVTNSSINSKYNSNQFYWSVANNDVIQFRKELGLLDHNNHHYDNYDERFSLNALSDIKYYVTNDEKTAPFGYSVIKKDNKKEAYENKYVLPLMYAYDHSMAYEEWAEMDIISKQEALLQAAILEDPVENSFKPSFTNHAVRHSLIENGLKIGNGNIICETSDASIGLAVDSAEKGEYYLVLEGFDTQNSINLSVTCSDGLKKTIYFKSETHTGNADKHDFAVNLGYREGLNDTVVLHIPAAGEYKFEKLALICQPLDEEIRQLEMLRNSIRIDTLSVNRNTVVAKINSDGDKILCAAIPYSKGWKAFVDGSEVQIQKVNGMYMGFDISKGEHEILLSYETPMLKAGAAVSLLSFLAGLYLVKRKTKAH